MSAHEFRELFGAVSNWVAGTGSEGLSTISHPLRSPPPPGRFALALRSRSANPFVATPLRIVGGTGSPVNPIAIV